MAWRWVRVGLAAACVASGLGCVNATVSDVVRTHAALAGGGAESVGVPEPAPVDAPVAAAESTAPRVRTVATEPAGPRTEGAADGASRPASGEPAAPQAPPVLGARGPRGRDDPSSRTPAIRGMAQEDEDAAASAAGRSSRRATRPAKRGAATGVPQVLGIAWWALAAALVVGCVLGLAAARRRSRRALLALRRRADGGHAWRTFRARLDPP